MTSVIIINVFLKGMEKRKKFNLTHKILRIKLVRYYKTSNLFNLFKEGGIYKSLI